MKRFFIFALFTLTLPSLSLGETLLMKMDFSIKAAGNLEPKGYLDVNEWTFQADAKSGKFFRPYFDQGGMVFPAKADQLGLLVKRTNLKGVTKVKLRLAVQKYPDGANWDQGQEREALMVAFSFGKKLYESGVLFFPAIPRFIGIFAGEKEKSGKAYQGRYYKKSARYFCAPCGATEGKLVTVEFDLAKAYRNTFYSESSREPIPAITGIAIEYDTRKLGAGEVLLESIELYGK